MITPDGARVYEKSPVPEVRAVIKSLAA
jgi:hypothetical protein